MAKTGLKNMYYSVATETPTTGVLKYSGATKPGKAISYSFEPSVSSATLYADDAIAEADTSVNGGTLTIGIDREDPTTYAALLGRTLSAGLETSNIGDTAPYVGFGNIVVLLQDGEKKYRAVFLPKVKFQEGSSSANTKGETTEFGTYELTGTVMPNSVGDWRKTQVFDTLNAADTWLRAQMAANASA